MYLLVIVFIIFICCYTFRFKKWKDKYFALYPAPPGNFLVGNAFDLVLNTHVDVLPLFTKYTTYAPTVHVRAFHLIGLLTIDYKFTEFLLTNNKILTKSVNYNFLNSWLGAGLLTSDGPKWKHDRKILTPAFHFEILKQFVETFEKVGDVFIKQLDKFDNSASFDLCPLVKLCTLDAICETAMGVEVNAQKGKNLSYVKGLHDMCIVIARRSLAIITLYKPIYILTPIYYLEKKLLKVLHGFTKQVLRQKQEELRSKESKIGKKLALLDLMLKFSNEGQGLDNDNIQNQVDTFMFAGHDTTAAGISFTLYCLANHPEIQKRVFEEQQLLFGSEKNPKISYNALQNMKFLELVIKESLRLYPPVPLIGRCPDTDIEYNNTIIPKNTNIGIFIYGMHRNPAYFPDPEKFNPDRFVDLENSHPFVYIPFSAGHRNCIGPKFAMLEMKSIISKVVRHFELRASLPKHELILSPTTVLTAINGVHVGINRRS